MSKGRFTCESCGEDFHDYCTNLACAVAWSLAVSRGELPEDEDLPRPMPKLTESQATIAAMPIAPSWFGCWSHDGFEDGSLRRIRAKTAKDAAVLFALSDFDGVVEHRNYPTPERIGVVDLDTGDSQFFDVRITAEVDPL